MKARIIFEKGLRRLKKASPVLMAGLACVGVGATACFAAKGALEGEKKVAERKDELTDREELVVRAKAYIPAAAVGAVTVASIVGSCVLGARQRTALVAASCLAGSKYNEYRSKTRELYGDEADAHIRSELAKGRAAPSGQDIGELTPVIPDPESGKKLFYEELSGRYFESTVEDVLNAEYHFNRNFALRGYADLNELYEFLRLPATREGEALGWSMAVGEIDYGYSWIDFDHEPVTLADGLEATIITMPFPPTADYMVTQLPNGLFT